MPKCSYCSQNYDVPRGLTFVLPNGEVLYFCSAKCQKNHKLGRKKEKVNWIKKFKRTKKEQEIEARKLSEERTQRAEEAKEAKEKAVEEAKK
jgi:large subunit ribosomal protein L24e